MEMLEEQELEPVNLEEQLFTSFSSLGVSSRFSSTFGFSPVFVTAAAVGVVGDDIASCISLTLK